MVKQRADLTFKNNLKRGRHGWVRLTPAYSVKIVNDILTEHSEYCHVLDPFSGTGTTGLASAQLGLDATLIDINPFLIWLAQVKTSNYTKLDLKSLQDITDQVIDKVQQDKSKDEYWVPPIHNIHRWWQPERLNTLSKIFHYLQRTDVSTAVANLLQIAFCRLVIDWSGASFNHQSMSFKDEHPTLFDESEMICDAFRDNVAQVIQGALGQVTGTVQVYQLDSRCMDIEDSQKYDCVITSPPYSNRMSYIRELRPYMYWLGYLVVARDAGELDWEAIGGTWGIATSRLSTWESQNEYISSTLNTIIKSISCESEVLANYVHKYMDDMYQHFRNLPKILKPNADIYYIVGNSKFYDTLVPVEKLYADMLGHVGFSNIQIKRIRKRNSKKELYEFLVSARNRT